MVFPSPQADPGQTEREQRESGWLGNTCADRPLKRRHFERDEVLVERKFQGKSFRIGAVDQRIDPGDAKFRRAADCEIQTLTRSEGAKVTPPTETLKLFPSAVGKSRMLVNKEPSVISKSKLTLLWRLRAPASEIGRAVPSRRWCPRSIRTTRPGQFYDHINSTSYRASSRSAVTNTASSNCA